MYFIAGFVLFLAITKFCVTFYFDVILAQGRGMHVVSGAALFPPDSPIVFCTIFCISLSLQSRTIRFVSGPFQSRLKTLCPLCLIYSECICLDQGHSVIQPQCTDQNQEIQHSTICSNLQTVITSCQRLPLLALPQTRSGSILKCHQPLGLHSK